MSTFNAREIARRTAGTPPTRSYGQAPAEPVDGRALRLRELRERLMTVEELATLPPPEFLVPDILPSKGLGFLYGPSGHGKSFVALDIGMSLAVGAPFAGRPTEPTTVLYILAEGSTGFSRRICAWNAHHPDSDDGKRFVTLPEVVNLADLGGVDTSCVSDIAEELEAKLIVIDTLARSMAGADENSAKDMGVVVANAERIAAATPGLVLVVHHTGKDETKGMRGSSAAFGGADVVMSCIRSQNEVTVKNTKMKDSAEFDPLHFKLVEKAGSLAVEFNDGAYVPTAPPEVVLALVQVIHARDDGTGVPNKVVQDFYESTTARGRSDYYTTKKQAIDRGLVRNIGSAARPRFSLLSAGEALLEENSP